MEMYKDMRGWWMSAGLSCHMTHDQAMPQVEVEETHYGDVCGHEGVVDECKVELSDDT